MNKTVLFRTAKAIAGFLAAAGLLSACSAEELAVRFDDESLRADARLEEILDAVSQQDSNALEAMFSETALRQTDDFSQQADALFRLVQGDAESWERTGFTSAANGIRGALHSQFRWPELAFTNHSGRSVCGYENPADESSAGFLRYKCFL